MAYHRDDQDSRPAPHDERTSGSRGQPQASHRDDLRGEGGRGRSSEDDYTRQLRDRYGHGHGGYDRDAYPQGGYGGSPEDRGVQTSGSRADGAMAVAQNRPFSESRGAQYRDISGLYQGGEDQPRHSGGRHRSGDEPWRAGEPRAGGFRGHGPKGYRRSDERIADDLCERLSDDDDIDASEIHVEVRDGVVTLTGTVPHRQMKHRAEDLAERCGGVTDIENRIRVLRQSGTEDSADTETRER